MIRIDDPSLAGEMLLYRRIPPVPDNVVWINDKPEFSSKNFADKDDEASFHIAAETTPDDVLKGHDGFGLVQITAGAIRTACINQKTNICAIIICRDYDDPVNGHVLVCGQINPKMRRRVSQAASWVEGRWPSRPQDSS